MRTAGVLAVVLPLALVACGSKKKEEAAGSGSASAAAKAPPVEDSEESVAKAKLKEIGELAVNYQRSKGTYLEGKVGPSPAKACCEQPKGECYQQDTDWSDPVWTALGFKERTMYTRYRYTYEGERLSFTATATADVNCDGKPKTFRIAGNYDADNMARVTEPELVVPVETGTP
ncbi:MAG TPA: hypothetical protein VM261_38710 [Kofleriaceae bacterium]|nr:hypothetical protein [Kofleriaceae bacterium]